MIAPGWEQGLGLLPAVEVGRTWGSRGGSPTLCQPLWWCAGLTLMDIGISHVLWPSAQLSFPSTTPVDPHEADLG